MSAYDSLRHQFRISCIARHCEYLRSTFFLTICSIGNHRGPSGNVFSAAVYKEREGSGNAQSASLAIQRSKRDRFPGPSLLCGLFMPRRIKTSRLKKTAKSVHLKKHSFQQCGKKSFLKVFWRPYANKR